MKYFLILISLVISLVATSQTQTYEFKGTTYPEANTLEEVVYNYHSIPVNCPPRKFKKLKREQEKIKRKYYGDTFLDRTKNTFVSAFKGAGRVALYVISGTIVTLALTAVLNKTT